jgi:hypothetical protein
MMKENNMENLKDECVLLGRKTKDWEKIDCGGGI